MRVVILVMTWLVAASAQADMYISIDANGGYVLSNVHRPGRHYERVISESLAQAGPVDAQMITGGPMPNWWRRRPVITMCRWRCCMP